MSYVDFCQGFFPVFCEQLVKFALKYVSDLKFPNKNKTASLHSSIDFLTPKYIYGKYRWSIDFSRPLYTDCTILLRHTYVFHMYVISLLFRYCLKEYSSFYGLNVFHFFEKLQYYVVLSEDLDIQSSNREKNMYKKSEELIISP